MKPNYETSWKMIPTFETTLRVAAIQVFLPLFVLSTMIIPMFLRLWSGDFGDTTVPLSLSLWFAASTLLVFCSLVVLCFFSLFLPSVMRRKLKLTDSSRHLLEEILRTNKERMKVDTNEYLFDSNEPNAFVFAELRRKPKIILTTALLDVLTTTEIQAVLRHELGHIRNRDAFFMMWGTIFAGTLKYWAWFSLALEAISLVFCWWFFPNAIGYPLGQILWISIIFGICFCSLNSVSRIREKLADAHVVDTDLSPALVSAIRKLYAFALTSKRIDGETKTATLSFPHLVFVNHNQSKWLKRWFLRYFIFDHPSVDDRIDSIQDKKFLVRKGRTYPLSIEIDFFAGLVSIILLGAILQVARYLPDVGLRILSYPISDFIGMFSLFLPVFVALFTTWAMVGLYSYVPSIKTGSILRYFVGALFHNAISYLVVIVFFCLLSLQNILQIGTAAVYTSLMETLIPLYFLYIEASVISTPFILLLTKFFWGPFQKRYPPGMSMGDLFRKIFHFR